MSGIPIRGTTSHMPLQAYTKAIERGARRADFLREYLDALYADAATVGVNPDVLVSQWDLETGSGTSGYWERDGNPGGLAAFDDGSNWGLTFSPQKAARAHVTHLCRYLGIDLSADWIATDARWQAVEDAGYVGSVVTTDDLGNGRWATDPQHAAKLRARYVAYWGEPKVQDQPVKDDNVALNFDPRLVPFPAYRYTWANNKIDGIGQDNLGPRTLRGNVWHRGLTGGQTLDQAVAYLIAPSTEGLTDGYIHNITGELVMLNPMKSLFPDLPAWWEDRAGWANGIYGNGRSPSTDAAGFVARFGGRLGNDIINQDLESLCWATMTPRSARGASRR